MPGTRRDHPNETPVRPTPLKIGTKTATYTKSRIVPAGQARLCAMVAEGLQEVYFKAGGVAGWTG